MESFYIRQRGRVLGPYDAEKLKSLALRGQLSKMHELSVDGISWVRAATYPEIFEPKPSDYPGDAPSTRESYVAEPQPAAGSQPGLPAGGGPPSEPSPTTAWHYAIDGKQMPPTDFAGLQQLAASGVVGPDTQVWQEGMSDWAPARNVSGLVWPGAGSQAAGLTRKSQHDLSSMLCRTALGSRGWAMFLAILGFATAAITAVYGMCVLLLGASRHIGPLVVTGITSFVQAALWLIGSRFLLGYASSLGGLRYTASSTLLTESLEWLRKFWMFTGITLIVVLTLLVLVLIAAFAGAVTMDEFSW